MDIIYIIIIILVLVNFYLVYKTININNKVSEQFETDTDFIKQNVLNVYKADIDAVRNLASFSSNIYNGSDTFVSPNDTLYSLLAHGKSMTSNKLTGGEYSKSTINNLIINGKTNIVPSGFIIMYSKTPIPPGWSICDGTNGTPDLSGRFILGAGKVEYPMQSYSSNDIEFILNQTGGEYKHELTPDEIPPHNHGYIAGLCNSHHCRGGISYKQSGSTHNIGYTDYSGGNSEGNTVKHENMPPYYVLYYIIKN